MAKRAGFIGCLVVCALGVGAGHALGDTPPAPTVIAADVQIGSVDVSGLTADEATTALDVAVQAAETVAAAPNAVDAAASTVSAASPAVPTTVPTGVEAPLAPASPPPAPAPAARPWVPVMEYVINVTDFLGVTMVIVPLDAVPS